MGAGSTEERVARRPGIHAQLASLRSTVDELCRAAVPVTEVSIEDRNTPYHTEKQFVIQA